MRARQPQSEFTMNASILDKAYDRLKRSIVDGHYRPGQRLRALQLARELKMSRTPVKEALGRLEQEGLVRREMNLGYIVRGLSVNEILGLYRVREALEVEAAREALNRIDDRALTEMMEALKFAERLLKQKRFNEFLRANRRFHKMIVAHTGNTVLEEVLNNLDARFWSIGTVVVGKHPERAEEIRNENRAILDAFVTNDHRQAEAAVKAHVRGAANAVRQFIEREPQHLLVVAA